MPRNKPITLKQFLTLHLNNDLGYGKITKLMIWSPAHHFWFYTDDWRWNTISNKEHKMLLKSRIRNIGLRNDMPDYIAVFLEDKKK